MSLSPHTLLIAILKFIVIYNTKITLYFIFPKFFLIIYNFHRGSSALLHPDLRRELGYPLH